MRWPLLVVALAACGDDGTPEPICTGGYNVCRGHLRDPDGRAMVLRGVNFAGGHKEAPYTDPFGPADFQQLRAWGFTTLRYIVPWAAIEPQRGVFDDAYLDGIRMRADWANDNGMVVIIDMHQDVFGEGFGFDGAPRWACDEARYAAFVRQDPWILNYTDPNVIACFDQFYADPSEFVAAWRHVAEKLADKPAIIGFDPMNEPHWGSHAASSFESDVLQPMYVSIIDAVREPAPQWVAFAEPGSSRNLGFATSLVKFDRPNIVYSPHLYDNTAETSGQFDQSHRDSILAVAGDLRYEADQLEAGLWIGEYGGQGNDPSITPYMDAVYDGASSAFAGGAYWAFGKGGGYDIYDQQGNEVAPLLNAIVRPAPHRVAGDLTAWTYDEATRTLSVEYVVTSAAPSIFFAPARVYPGGVIVDAPGAEIETAGDEVRVTATKGATVTVTIKPVVI